MADEWPSFSDELSRKTTAQIKRWSLLFDAEKISKREFFIVLTGIYESTSGLVHRDVGEMIAALCKSLK